MYDWVSTYDEDVNVNATNFTNRLLNMAEKCIPPKTVTVRPQDLPWMNNNLRKLMRNRNRLFKKYKKDKSVETYNKFKKIRNEVASLLRKSKKDYIISLATKSKSSNLTAKDYWKTLKSFINPTLTSSIPPLYDNETYVSDSTEKANLFNNYFAQ